MQQGEGLPFFQANPMLTSDFGILKEEGTALHLPGRNSCTGRRYACLRKGTGWRN